MNISVPNNLALAEHFHSIQGEGSWVGSAMHFIRLAGCSVGKFAQPNRNTPKLVSGKFAWRCASYDNRPFWCDTDFSKYEERTPSELLAETWEARVCLTGGEPLMHLHKLDEFFRVFANKMIHLETSGTIPIPKERRSNFYWVTVAPKVGVLPDVLCTADEVRLLVDDKFDPDSLPADVRWHHNVFLCPINNVESVCQKNLELAMRWQEKFPRWRLSCQLHKFLGVR